MSRGTMDLLATLKELEARRVPVITFRARLSEVDFNLGRESPSQTEELKRNRFNLKLLRFSALTHADASPQVRALGCFAGPIEPMG